MPARATPRPPVYVEPHVIVTDPPSFTGVQTHTDAHRFATNPVVAGQRVLGRNHRPGGGGGASEDDEEGVAFRAQLAAVVLCDRAAHQPALIVQDAGPVVPEFLEQAGGTLDVREKEGDGPSRAFRRGGHRCLKPEGPARFANLTRAGPALQGRVRSIGRRSVRIGPPRRTGMPT